MNSIVYVGMDVHTTNYTLSCYTIENNQDFATVKMEPDYRNVLKYLEKVQENYGDSCEFRCGYEAGCLGFTLYHQLTEHNVKCVILAPSTMPSKKGEIKTDKRDAMKIARCLAYNTYSAVHIPTKEDSDVKEYIRMRDAHKMALKRVKQQILAFCKLHDLRFDGGKNYWTLKHLAWLKNMPLDDMLREILDEYLVTFNWFTDKIERMDKRIAELATGPKYAEKVKKLSCMIGIRTHTALALIVETGDFSRFAKAGQYAAFLGLVPGEHSSSDDRNQLGITKAGNTHLRRLLTEAAQCYGRGRIGYKSKQLKERQAGNSPKVIAYADKANERLRRKFYRMVLKNNKRHNVAVAAIARELACFVWGMMTGRIA
ncbi:IS110 family transposase [Mitsuokella sp.]|uniref:IS110 family transposase n=1 Tax=Mitsuokella sp. TaxID=2049034 RepID=UPI003D7DE588